MGNQAPQGEGYQCTGSQWLWDNLWEQTIISLWRRKIPLRTLGGKSPIRSFPITDCFHIVLVASSVSFFGESLQIASCSHVEFCFLLRIPSIHRDCSEITSFQLRGISFHVNSGRKRQYLLPDSRLFSDEVNGFDSPNEVTTGAGIITISELLWIAWVHQYRVLDICWRTM